MLSAFQKCLCGKNDVESADDATRIVGGKEGEENKHPWQAYLPLKLLPHTPSQVSLQRKDGSHWCGASLISKYFLKFETKD